MKLKILIWELQAKSEQSCWSKTKDTQFITVQWMRNGVSFVISKFNEIYTLVYFSVLCGLYVLENRLK